MAWRAATGAARTRARAFVVTFGIRDVCWGILYSKAVWDLWFGSYSMITDPTDPVYLVYALGTLLAGLLAAALVVFFLAPLQRFADRVASAAMPHTQNTPEYAAHRKMRVYESAVAEAMQGGRISETERALLNRLRDTLGIVKTDADALERDLQRDTAG